ncbi:unnamed protein product [Rotaria sp. Silwood2]|nr:unnamed protein product [Rotaria sp. Silwood2]CAF2571408.1 unnamed protein product [Rotaria sp. Silwood2]CAF2964798.1 unnamed protein product [Rotaria sp. Silwood2]CAF4065542.1 unnamed protein product [Rotaria sp. Silwood2]CAF4468275.1 unnamed protein product [Rotaria sp. Silwood2]
MNSRTIFIHMSDYNTLKNTNTSEIVVANNRFIKLAILLPFQVLSIICSLFVFINIIYRPSKLIKPIGNHFILALLITSFVQVTTELSMVENYLHTGIVRPSTYGYCLFFNWYEFSLNGISLFVMVWASIERHIMIFSQPTFQIQWKRITFHYVPLSIAILYTPICYGYLIYIYNCFNNWNYYELLCTAPCYYQNKILGAADWLVNIIIPAFAIVFANILLITRVVYRSTGIRHNAERTKKNRKMTIQLLAISSLFLIFWLPIAVTGLIQQFFYPTFIIDVQFNIFFYLIYFIQLFLPFVCLISLPELKKIIIIKIRRWTHRNMVGDTTALQVGSVVPTLMN